MSNKSNASLRGKVKRALAKVSRSDCYYVFTAADGRTFAKFVDGYVAGPTHIAALDAAGLMVTPHPKCGLEIAAKREG